MACLNCGNICGRSAFRVCRDDPVFYSCDEGLLRQMLGHWRARVRFGVFGAQLSAAARAASVRRHQLRCMNGWNRWLRTQNWRILDCFEVKKEIAVFLRF